MNPTDNDDPVSGWMTGGLCAYKTILFLKSDSFVSIDQDFLDECFKKHLISEFFKTDNHMRGCMPR